MAVRYVVGRAGKGKSHYILKEIEKELRAAGEHKLFLVVPEQFTLQAERDLIQKLALPGIMRLEVLSFTRLAGRVFDEIGGLKKTLINEQGKTMVLKKIIDENARELGIYQKASKQEGFITKISEVLADFKQQGIAPAALEDIAAQFKETSIIRQKLQDIVLIYQGFNEYMQGHYIDTEDYFKLFIDSIEKAEILKGAKVWIDAFSTFSPQSLKIVEKIMGLAADTVISFTMEVSRGRRDSDLFNLSRYSYQKIHEMAVMQGLKEDLIHMDANAASKYRKPEILHLESELYAYPGREYQGEVDNVELFAANNIHTEIENMAIRLVSLVREKNCRWKDMAVVCNDMDSYAALIKRTFAEYRIPYFIDRKRDIMNNPIIQALLLSLEILDRGYTQKSMLAFLKTGFADLNAEQGEKLENFILSHGIKGKRWLEVFSQGEEVLEEFEACRQKIIFPLEELLGKTKGKKYCLEITTALYEYLETINIPEKLLEWTEVLRSKGEYELLSENTQIWNIVMDVFDQIAEILGDQMMSIREYKKVLEAGLLSFELGIIPTTIDQVLVGNIQRSKSHDIKGMFILGVNDGLLPSGKDEEGILAPEEKEFLQDNGLRLDFRREMRAEEERFLIYSAFSKAENYLWISYALADVEGKALRPSLLIDRLRKLFPGLKAKTDVFKDRSQELQEIVSPQSSFKFLVENLRLHADGKPVEDFWWDVYSWYYEHEEWQELRESITEALFYSNQPEYIGRRKAKRLFGFPLRSGVSRMEQFVSCPFAHFIRYGLKAKERKVFEVGAPDIGELLHNTILSFTESLAADNIDWRQLPKEECISRVDKVMEELLPVQGNGVLQSTFRYRYLATRLQRIARRAIWTLTEHLKKGEFEFLGHEITFGRNGYLPAMEVELASGERIFLEGRIDRVDLLREDNATYVKIIDYKTGEKQLSLSDIYSGLALQLIVYLAAVLDSEEKINKGALKAAGIFYFKIDDPLVDTKDRIIEKIELEIARRLKMKGVVLQDVKLVQQMDQDIQGYSSILPVAVNKNGEFYSNSSVLMEEDFRALIVYAKSLLKEIGQEIMAGKISIEPVKKGQQTACAYCHYRSICHFDKLFAGNKFKNIYDMSNEEVLEKIKRSESGYSII